MKVLEITICYCFFDFEETKFEVDTIYINLRYFYNYGNLKNYLNTVYL